MMKTIVRIVVAIVIAGGLLFVSMFVLTRGEYPVPRTVGEDSSIPHVTISGVTFHSESFGEPSRPVVIVVHGGPGWDYRSLLSLKTLSDEFYVVFYDQRGTGLSPRVDPGEVSLESSIGDLDSLVNHFGHGEKVRLIGHSWGAMLVSGYLSRHPDKVSHAVLAEPAFLTTELARQSKVRFGPRWEAGFLLRATRVWFESLQNSGPYNDAASDYFLGQIAPYANQEYYCNGIVPNAGTEHWRAGAQSAQAILRSALDASGAFQINLVDGVDRFQRRVLFLASECNHLIGYDQQMRHAKLYANATVVVISGSGHAMFGEKPDESIHMVRNYLHSLEGE
jgi:proline iminopeptidase